MTKKYQNGEVGICKICGKPIEYYYGWKHKYGENSHQIIPEEEVETLPDKK